MSTAEESNKNFHIARNFVKQKISDAFITHEYYEPQRNILLEILKRTVDSGESDSVLVIGPRGCGKTNLVKSVISELKKIQAFQKAAAIVELNGFIHTDDSLCLKDITRQLHIESIVGERQFRSVAENLTFVLESLKSGNKGSKATIFIIDEFDLFCSRENQFLIYSLFDVAQAAQTPLCLLGLTSSYNVIDLLEERIKSRFSRRQLLLHGAGSTEGLKSRCLQIRQLFTLTPQLCAFGIHPSYVKQWNNNIVHVTEDKIVQNIINQCHQMDASENAFRNFLFQVVSQLSIKKQLLEPSDFVETYEEVMEDSKMNLLFGLSVLELCLVIAMKHFTEIYNGDPFNFELILRSYLRFVRQNSSVLVTQRSVILKAFQHLKAMEFITLAEGEAEEKNNKFLGGKQKQEEFKMYRLMLTDEQIDTVIRNYPNLPTEVSQWGTSSLH